MSELVSCTPFPPADESQPRLLLLSDLIPAWLAEAESQHRARTGGRPLGAVTALRGLDTMLGGCLPPGLHILHGQPGAGKSALALQVAAQCGVPALYATCEMSPLELLRRITARVTQTYLGRLKSGEFTPDEAMTLLERAIIATPSVGLLDGTRFPIRLEILQKAARVLRDRVSGPPPRPEAAPPDRSPVLVVVDSVHSLAESTLGHLPEYEALNATLSGLRQLASTLECPVLVIAERNRASMNTGGLSAGAGTRKIEYGAESVLDLRREPDAQPDAAGEVPVVVSLPKNRNGITGTEVKLLFHGALQRFRELA